MRRSVEDVIGVKKDNYPGLPEELKEFSYVYPDDNGRVIMAIPESLLERATANGDADLDMYECPVPVKYVLDNGYRIFKGHVICDAKYEWDLGLDVDEKWYEYL